MRIIIICPLFFCNLVAKPQVISVQLNITTILMLFQNMTSILIKFKKISITLNLYFINIGNFKQV